MCNVPFSNPFWAKTTALPAFQNNDSWCALCQLSLFLLWKCRPNSFQNLLGHPLLSLESDTVSTKSNLRSRFPPHTMATLREARQEVQDPSPLAASFHPPVPLYEAGVSSDFTWTKSSEAEKSERHWPYTSPLSCRWGTETQTFNSWPDHFPHFWGRQPRISCKTSVNVFCAWLSASLHEHTTSTIWACSGN